MTDDRAGLDQLRARLLRLQALAVHVGVLQPKPTEDGKSRIAVVAAANEYGTRDIPQRSFIGRTLDQQRAKIGELQAQAIHAVVAGTPTPERAARAVGAGTASMVRDTIRSNVPPALKAETVRRKGHGRTLIHHGQLLRSIAHQVVDERGGGSGA